ncbi:MAG: acyl-CoA thioesterase [Gemmatimonadetes bacterium]|jgi:acyl-CoA thioester hydrolase|nr:acyl-CoA thioesterase [Gemmatimonadota bacterium]MDQ3310361.1 acyl-CoA thioesterase [Gemmatimonadota bacterium]MDQ3520919.1 acyl-CoA thioesterase [Gemmatimonadota bacterium]
MEPSQIRSTVELRVRYAETDQMGVVYHANYLVWCEVGRTELIRRMGVAYAELERDGVFLAVSDAHLRFHGSARYDDLVAVETRLEELRSRQLKFAYQIFRKEPDVRQRLVTASTTLTALDRSGRPCKLPRAVLSMFSSVATASAA